MNQHIKIQASLILTSLIALGCSCPHRRALTVNTMEWFAGRPDGLIARETRRDTEGGGGIFLLSDPSTQSMLALHTNQSGLGGGSVFSAGAVSITVDTNTAPILSAVGTAVGNVIGAAAKSAAR
jgi:hypothetical protein